MEFMRLRRALAHTPSIRFDAARQLRGNSVHYVGQAVATAFWFFVFWYGGWAFLWAYQQIPMRPHAGWWKWALPLAAIFAVLERLSVDLEARETTAGAPGFWGPYLRQAAIGMVFGLGLLVIGINAELLQWPPDLLEDQFLGLMAAVFGA